MQYKLEKDTIGSKLRNLHEETYFFPLNDQTKKKMDELFLHFTDGQTP